MKQKKACTSHQPLGMLRPRGKWLEGPFLFSSKGQLKSGSTGPSYVLKGQKQVDIGPACLSAVGTGVPTQAQCRGRMNGGQRGRAVGVQWGQDKALVQVVWAPGWSEHPLCPAPKRCLESLMGQDSGSALVLFILQSRKRQKLWTLLLSLALSPNSHSLASGPGQGSVALDSYCLFPVRPFSSEPQPLPDFPRQLLFLCKASSSTLLRTGLNVCRQCSTHKLLLGVCTQLCPPKLSHIPSLPQGQRLKGFLFFQMAIPLGSVAAPSLFSFPMSSLCLSMYVLRRVVNCPH